MLGISAKRTEAVDLATPLVKYIRSNFSKDDAKSLDKNIKEIAHSRERMREVVSRSDTGHEKAISALVTYLSNLNTMTHHFPFGSYQGSSFFRREKVAAVMVPFTWYDAFRAEKKSASHDVNFEKAAVCFNIGAAYSLAGIREDRTTGEGLARACKWFQQASGVFAFLSTRSDLENSATADTTADSYRMLSHLMLAQAQACWFEKAVKQKMSPALVAKLASGTAALFGHAHEASCRRGVLRGWLEKTRYPWQRHLDFQRSCFRAAAQYWHAKVHLSQNEYGEEISRLYTARDTCKAAKKIGSGLIRGLTESRDKLDDMVLARLHGAVKDNESIYHMPIPTSTQLKGVEEKILVKVVPFDIEKVAPRLGAGTDDEKQQAAAAAAGGGGGDGRAKTARDPFSALVPLKVKEAASMWTAKMRSVGSELTRECKEASDMAKMHLSSLNLPAALEAMRPEEGLPEETWTRVREVQLKGGMAALEELRAAVRQSNGEAEKTLGGVMEVLMQEAEDDGKMRQQFGSRWNRVPSQQITVQFHKDIEDVSKFMSEATKSDEGIDAELKQHAVPLAKLSLSKEDLEAQLPKLEKQEQDSKPAQDVRVLLDALSALLEKRAELSAAFQKLLNEEEADVTPRLVQAQGVRTNDQVFSESRKKYEPVQRELAANLEEQKKVLPQITAANERFVATRQGSESLQNREKFLHALNDAAVVFDRLQANLSEGLGFYSDLVRDYLSPLQQTVADFAMARGEEKRIILEQLTARIAGAGAGGGAGGAAAAPAARGGGDGGNNSNNNNNNNAAGGGGGAYPAPPGGYPQYQPVESPAPQQVVAQPQPQVVYQGQPQVQQVRQAYMQPQAAHAQNPNMQLYMQRPVYPHGMQLQPQAQPQQQQQQQQQQPQQQQQQGGWRNFFGGN